MARICSRHRQEFFKRAGKSNNCPILGPAFQEVMGRPLISQRTTLFSRGALRRVVSLLRLHGAGSDSSGVQARDRDLRNLLTRAYTRKTSLAWILPPLSTSRIINIVWLYIALSRTPNMDCYWGGGGSTQRLAFKAFLTTSPDHLLQRALQSSLLTDPLFPWSALSPTNPET